TCRRTRSTGRLAPRQSYRWPGPDPGWSGPRSGALSRSVAGGDVDAVDLVEQVGAPAAVLVDLLGDPGEGLQEFGVVGPRGGRRQQLLGPAHGRHHRLVVTPEAVDLGCHLDRVVEQLVEQAVGGLGEVDVLAPGATEAREGPAHGQDPGVG